MDPAWSENIISNPIHFVIDGSAVVLVMFDIINPDHKYINTV